MVTCHDILKSIKLSITAGAFSLECGDRKFRQFRNCVINGFPLLFRNEKTLLLFLLTFHSLLLGEKLANDGTNLKNVRSALQNDDSSSTKQEEKTEDKAQRQKL